MSQEHTLPTVSDRQRALFKWLRELELESQAGLPAGSVTGSTGPSDLVVTVTMTDSKSTIEAESVSQYAHAAHWQQV